MRWLAGIIVILLVGAALTYRHYEATDLDHSVAVAQRTWGPVCGGRIPEIMRKDLPVGVAGKAILRIVGGIYVTCKIEIDRRDWTAEQHCAVIVHEWGHLKREDNWHSSDPDSIMYPVLSRRNIPAAC